MREPTTPGVADLIDDNVRTIRQIENEIHAQRGATNRLADRVIEVVGGGPMLWAQLLVIAGWVGYNLWPGAAPFDPYPFTLLTLVASIEAIFLAILILMSQRHAALVTERRSQMALQINLLTEQENTKMLELLHDIGQRLGLPVEKDAHVDALKQQTQADTVADSIARAESQDAPAKKR